jgi:hypothetical protein
MQGREKKGGGSLAGSGAGVTGVGGGRVVHSCGSRGEGGWLAGEPACKVGPSWRWEGRV